MPTATTRSSPYRDCRSIRSASTTCRRSMATRTSRTCRARAFSASRSSPARGPIRAPAPAAGTAHEPDRRTPCRRTRSPRRRRRDRRRTPLHDDARRSEARVIHADQRGARHLSREGRSARRSPRAAPSCLTTRRRPGQQDEAMSDTDCVRTSPDPGSRVILCKAWRTSRSLTASRLRPP